MIRSNLIGKFWTISCLIFAFLLGIVSADSRNGFSSKLSFFSVSDFKSREMLGSGGGGEVWKCSVEKKEIIDSDYVAIKYLKSPYEKIQSEANFQCRVKHPHITKVFGVVQNTTQYEVVMELVEGGSLRGLLQEEDSLSIEAVLLLSQQIAKGLSFLHSEAKIVHSDLKPGNILLTRNKQVKISDFSISARLPERTTRNTILTSHIHGYTPGYKAPELHCMETWRPTEADPAIDMWAYAIILKQMMEKVPREQHSSHAGQLVNEAVERCLQMKPSDRASSTEVVRLLRYRPKPEL